jgi:hypothetical protein
MLLKDGQLMRTLKLLALGVLFIAGTAISVNAQAPATPAAPQEQVPPATQAPPTPAPQPTTANNGRFFLSVSLGGQSKEQTFTDSSRFTIYNEPTGAVAAAHSIGGGTLFDLSVGAKVWKDFGVGIAYSALKNRNDATVSVRVPHPVIFGQPRTATATIADVEHTENVVHLQVLWMIPVTSKFQVTAMAGPSFFTVRQAVASVQAPQDISDPAPFNNVTIRTVSLTDVKDSPIGVNVGVDGTYLIRTIGRVGVGVGGFVRYSGASLDLTTPDGVTRDTELKTGGPQGALGLRLRF